MYGFSFLDPAPMYIPTAMEAPRVFSDAIFTPLASVVTCVVGATAGAVSGSGTLSA